MNANPRPLAPELLPLALLIIERLADAVERETRDLNGPGPIDYRAHSQRKSQGLLELTRLATTLASARGHPRLRQAVNDLLHKLDANKRLLYAKLQAARAVAEVVARAISEGQSDGTYSEQIWRDVRR